MKEIRIYYESIEQGANYIKPIIEECLNNNHLKAEIKLVKLKHNYLFYSKKLAPIIFWKNPDIILTTILNGVEYPLVQIEFSSAVFTEDHELQRFDGMVTSAENNCIYVKISPIHKESDSVHGGNIHFDYVRPFYLILKKFKMVFYHFDWPLNDNGLLDVDENYLSVPKSNENFNKLIEAIVKYIYENNYIEDGWIKEVEKDLLKEPFFKEWKKKLENFEQPDTTNLQSSRTEFNSIKNELTLKFNRFGHAMDPERGMLAYYGQLYDKIIVKMVFSIDNSSWYKNVPKESEIMDHIHRNGLNRVYDFLYCFMLGSGLDNNDEFKELISTYKDNETTCLEIDLTKFLENNYLLLNKPLRTIFKYSNKFLITDGNGNPKINFVWKNFNKKEEYATHLKITHINSKNFFDEDDVTYIIVHNVLKVNKFKILAVSYPGAQGDRVILIEPHTGRSQERRYIDIISYFPEKFTTLQENKGSFNAREIRKEIDELSKYKKENRYKKAINSFIEKFDIKAPKIIKIGVGFWANLTIDISNIRDLDLDNLDYFVYLTKDRRKWIIWTGKDCMFNIKHGEISIPNSFEVSEIKLGQTLLNT